MSTNPIPSRAFDVFLSHNSGDKPAVEHIAQRLLAREHIEPWLDKWNLIPGDPWQAAIERALADCRSCAVFVGAKATGPWQIEEMRAAIDRRVRDSSGSFRVIPVLLPGGCATSFPTFAVAGTWVEFKDLDDEDALHRLASGIRGLEPGRSIDRRNSDSERARDKFVVVITATVDELQTPLIEAIVAHLRTKLGDASLTLQKIEQGSVIMTFEARRATSEWIVYLFRTGQLDDIVGFAIRDVAISPPETLTSRAREVPVAGVVPSRKESTSASLVFLSLRLLAVSGVLACGILSTTVFLWVTVSAIALLTVLSLRTTNKDAARLEWLGDQMYSLGYLCTIAAFATMLLRAYLESKTTVDPRFLLTMAGVGFISTISGLIAMTVLKAIARERGRTETLAEQTVLIVAEQVHRQIDSIGTILSELSGSSNQRESLDVQLASNIERLKTLVADLNEPSGAVNDMVHALDLLQEQMKQLSVKADQSRSSAELMVLNAKELDGVLGEFIDQLSRKQGMRQRDVNP